MKPQHVIHLSGSGIVLYTWDRRRYVPVAGHALPDGDPAPLLAYLAQTPSATIVILADVPDEEHVRDQIPALGRADRNALLTRKLARHFPRTEYRTALVQGQSGEGRKLRHVLFSALTRPDHLARLQDQLAAAQLPVAGVVSPALFSRVLIDRLGPATPANTTLLVSRQREGGLRISFCRGRDLAGSRLIRPGMAAAPGDLPRVLQQLEESVRYFDAACVPGAHNPIDVILLCEPVGDRSAVPTEGIGDEGFRLHMPDPVVAARALGLDEPLRPGDADLLFIGLLRHHVSAGNFAPAKDRRYFRLHRIGSLGRAACVVLASASLLGAGLNGIASLQMSQDRRDLDQTTAELEQALQAPDETVVPDDIDPLAMQQAVGTVQALERHAIAPTAILSLVSAALDRRPDIQLDELRWEPLEQVATTAAADDESGAAGDDAIATDGSATRADTRTRLSVRAHVSPFNGNYPAAFAGMHAFMATLERDPRVASIKATSEPLDINPRSTLAGESSPTTRDEQASFSLELTLRLADDRA